MIILCTVDITTREVTIPSDQRIASYDHKVDVIRFQVETIPGFSLDTSSIKIAAQGPNKARHDYAVDPSTVQIEEETGYITFDWPIPAGVTEMPIGTFKYGDRGQLIFAVCAEIISGDTVSKAWHSDDGIITVVAHLEPESGGGEDPEEEATNAQKIGQLQTDVAVINTQVGALGNGSPTPVAAVAEMTDESAVYLYTGSESGYTAGNWYFWNGSAWTSGGTYGGAVTDTTLSISGAAADAKATGEALAEKVDAADYSELSAQVDTNTKDIGGLKADLCEVQLLEFDLLKSAVWETGTVNPSTGANQYSDIAIRTNYVSLYVYNLIAVKIDSGYKWAVALINADKTETVNSFEFATGGKTFDLKNDFPTAKYARFVLQKTDNTLPDSGKYIHASYGTVFSNFVESALVSGDVSYNDLDETLQSTLVYKYKTTEESLSYPNVNSLLNINGGLTAYTGNYNVSDYIDCSTWLSLKYSGRQYYDGQGLAFYDENHAFISCFPNSKSGVHDYTNVVISVPTKAKYIRVAQYEPIATHVYVSDELMPSNIGYKWKGKKWCCLGDSLTEVNSTASKRYHDYVAESTGITVVNLGVGGTGYMNGGSGSNPFRNRVSDIPLDADVITIFGSFNDLGYTRPLGTENDTGVDTIGGCINTTLDAIFTRITLANLGIITPTPWANAYPLDNESSNQFQYVQLLKDICERRGIPCLDLFHCSQLRPWDSDFKSAAYSNDSTGVHPDENGHRLIAPRFEGFLDTLLLV